MLHADALAVGQGAVRSKKDIVTPEKPKYGIYSPLRMDYICSVSGCNLHGGYNIMLSMVYLGRALKLM